MYYILCLPGLMLSCFCCPIYPLSLLSSLLGLFCISTVPWLESRICTYPTCLISATCTGAVDLSLVAVLSSSCLFCPSALHANMELIGN